MHARQVPDARAEFGPLVFEPCHVGCWWRFIHGLPACTTGPLLAFKPNLVFQPAPLAAQFSLMSSSAGNRFRVVRKQSGTARFEAIGEVADEEEPSLNQSRKLGKVGIHN